MKRITCFTESLGGGGAEHQMVILAGMLAEKGYDVTIVTYASIPDHYDTPKGVKRVDIPAYTIVASNSLVNKNFKEIGEHCMIGGVPAKYISDGVERLLLNDREIDKLFNGTNNIIDYEDIKEELHKEKYQR
jgi:hypothetical protein